MHNESPFGIVEVLKFLATGKVVLTNSFHGVYWSMLLKRRPVVFEPNSNRFMSISAAPWCDRSNWQEVTDRARISYKETLHIEIKNCRRINDGYAWLIKRLIDDSAKWKG